MRRHRAVSHYWVYHNITVLIASVAFALILFQTSLFRAFFHTFSALGYLGVFLVGIIFPSSFTVVPATAALLLLTRDLHYFFVAVAAGVGSVIGDYLIFRFIRNGLTEDLTHLFSGFGGSRIARIFHSKYFGVLTPIVGALIIASPLPDELGIGLLGASRLSDKKFILLSLVLNIGGLVILLGAFQYF